MLSNDLDLFNLSKLASSGIFILSSSLESAIMPTLDEIAISILDGTFVGSSCCCILLLSLLLLLLPCIDLELSTSSSSLFELSSEEDEDEEERFRFRLLAVDGIVSLLILSLLL